MGKTDIKKSAFWNPRYENRSEISLVPWSRRPLITVFAYQNEIFQKEILKNNDLLSLKSLFDG